MSELGHNINTFSVVVDESGLNEETYIKEVVSKYNKSQSNKSQGKYINQDILNH